MVVGVMMAWRRAPGGALGGVHGAGVVQLRRGRRRSRRRGGSRWSARTWSVSGSTRATVMAPSSWRSSDLPDVPVGHEPAAGVLLVRSLRRVTMRSPIPARFPSARRHGPTVVDDPGRDQMVADPAGQAGGLFVGVGQQERCAGRGPGRPRRRRRRRLPCRLRCRRRMRARRS